MRDLVRAAMSPLSGDGSFRGSFLDDTLRLPARARTLRRSPSLLSSSAESADSSSEVLPLDCSSSDVWNS